MTGVARSHALDTGAAPAAPALETLLGDPFDDGSVTFAAIAQDEDASRLTPDLRSRCDAWGLGRELVPHEFGGRRASAAQLVARLRPLFRRDVSLGVDLVVAPLSVITTALATADGVQRRDLAERIASGARVGAVLADQEARAGAGGIRLRREGAGWMADGESPLVASADAPQLWALPARTAGAPEALVLCDTRDARVDIAPWVETVGLRGTRFGVATVRALPREAVDVFRAETGSRALERARSETAAIVAALAIAAVDTAVHLALPYAAERRLYRGTVLDIPHVRGLLAEVHTDLLIADALAGQVVQGMDAGEFDEVAASAAAYLVPHLLSDAMRALSVLFGSTFYARVEPYAVFETFVRDIGSLSLLGLGTPRSLEPCVTALATWDGAASLTAGGEADELSASTAQPLARRSAAFAGRLRSPESIDATASRGLAREGAILIAADACIALRRTGAAPATDAWLTAALVRLGVRLTGRKTSVPEASIESAVDDLTSCVDAGRSVTLERVPVFGRSI